MLPQTSNHEPSNSTPLTETTKSVDVEKGSDDQHPRVRDYRKLAICSIICGLSCFGIMSLIYSVKTREFTKKSGRGMTAKAKEYSTKTLKWGISAIVAWLLLVIAIPLILGLVSFLLTFID